MKLKMKMKIVNFFRINKKEENNITTSNLNNIIAEDDMRTKPNINKKLVITGLNLTNKKQKEKIIEIIKEIILFLIIFISAIEYKKSLRVPEQEEKDFDMDPVFFMGLIYDCFLSSFFITIALFLIEFKICKIYQLVLIIIIYLLYFITNRGENLDGHGTYNTIVFLIGIAIGQIVILIIFLFTLCYKKKKSIPFIIIAIIAISSYIIYKVKVENKVKCKGWEIGLNNTKLDNYNTKSSCNLIVPNHKCYLNLLGPLFDLSKGISCEKRKEEEETKLKSISTSKYITESTKRIGFPITTHRDNFNLNKQQNSQKLFNEIMKNLVDMDNKEQLKDLGEKEKPEVVLDYTKNKYGEIHININYDEELSKERKKLENNTYPLYENIIFLFFDAISRTHFSRIFKKSAEFIDKFFKYEGINNEKDPSQKYHGFQFFKQQSFKEFTLGNNIPMFYGRPYYFKKVESITKDFKEKGYITCNVNGICNKEAFYFDWRLKDDMERNFEEFDHEMFSLSCDPNIFDVEKPHSIALGESSVFRRCLYGKESVDYLFEYGIKFLEAYNKNRKYLRISIPNGHELTGQVSKYVDESLYEFLNYIFINNLLKNTTVILSADHGLNILVLYKLFHALDHEVELTNPFLIFIISDQKGKTYEEQYKNIHENQQKFVTTYDIYHSLRHIIYGYDIPINKKKIEEKEDIFNSKKHFLGTSLFNYIDPSERICKNYIDITQCICIDNK